MRDTFLVENIRSNEHIFVEFIQCSVLTAVAETFMLMVKTVLYILYSIFSRFWRILVFFKVGGILAIAYWFSTYAEFIGEEKHRSRLLLLGTNATLSLRALLHVVQLLRHSNKHHYVLMMNQIEYFLKRLKVI